MIERERYSIQQAVLKWEASGARELGLPKPGAYVAEGRIADRIYLGPGIGGGWTIVDNGVAVGTYVARTEALAAYRGRYIGVAKPRASRSVSSPKAKPSLSAPAAPETDTKARGARREIPLSLRYRVLNRDGFRCVKCGRSPATELNVKLHVDHKVPWSIGGDTVESNLQTMCSDCNLGKSNRHTG